MFIDHGGASQKELKTKSITGSGGLTSKLQSDCIEQIESNDFKSSDKNIQNDSRKIS